MVCVCDKEGILFIRNSISIYLFILIFTGIMPNVETKVLLAQIFGEKSHPMRKYQRIMYWFPKFKHTNPYPVPQVLSSDPIDLARFILPHIASDPKAKITVYQVNSHCNHLLSQRLDLSVYRTTHFNV